MNMTTKIANEKEIRLSLPEGCNQNFLVWGDSGMGKSYCNCRLIENAIKDGRNVLIADFSRSFTEEQLREHKISVGDNLEIHDISSKNMAWTCRYTDTNTYRSDVADAFIAALGIRGRFQKKVLRKHYKKFAADREITSIPEFLCYLEDQYKNKLKNKEAGEDITSLKQVIDLLSDNEHLTHFFIHNQSHGTSARREGTVTLIQLSGLPDLEKQFMTTFIIELVWKEMKLPKECRHCDVLVLDEFQHITRHANGSLKQMFCQGRKEYFNVILSTQFLTQYSEEDINAFAQNGGFFIFKPAEKNENFSVSMIRESRTKEKEKQWLEILNELDVGDAVYCGKYVIEGKSHVYKKPIVCHIEDNINQKESAD